LFLLATAKKPKISEKTRKTAGKMALYGAVGAGSWLLYKYLSKNKPAEFLEGPTELVEAPEGATHAEVHQIAQQTVNTTLNEITRLQTEYLEKITLRDRQKLKIDEIQSQIDSVEQQIRSHDAKLAEFDDKIAGWDWDIENIHKINFNNSERVYLAARNTAGQQRSKLATLEYELDAIYDRNEFWNPAWYIEKGNKEREVQQQRSDTTIAETNEASAYSQYLTHLNALNGAKQNRDNEIVRKNDYFSTNVQPLINQKMALEQTKKTYVIAFDAINIELETLKQQIIASGGNVT